MKLSPALNLRAKDVFVFQNVAKALTAELDLSETLRAVIRPMEPLFQPEQWTLLVLDEERQELRTAASAGRPEGELREARLPVGQGMAGWVVEHGEPLVIPQAEHHPRLQQPEAGGDLRIRSAVCMPVRARGRTLGVLQLYNCGPQAFAPDAMSLLEALCDFAAVAVENARLAERVQELTAIDDCTGLYNQSQLYRMLERAVEHWQMSDAPFSLCFVELDSFKQVNDEHGHLAGSRALREFGQALRSQVRPVDSVFRYGGDEFVVLLHDTGKNEAERVVRRVHQSLRSRSLSIGEGLDLSLTASYGVATWPADGEKVDQLIRSASMAMHRVKASTRDDVAIAGENVQPR